jgi:hypothetical protein
VFNTGVPAITTTGQTAGERSVTMAALICSTCGGSPESPYRRANGEGCVSGAHNDHADAWHLRPEAEAIRAGETWGLLVPA